MRRKTVYTDDKNENAPVSWDNLIYPARIFDLRRYDKASYVINSDIVNQVMNAQRKSCKRLFITSAAAARSTLKRSTIKEEMKNTIASGINTIKTFDKATMPENIFKTVGTSIGGLKAELDPLKASEELSKESQAGKEGVSHIREDHISQIGEIDIEVLLRIDISKKAIQGLFVEIDKIRLREPSFFYSSVLGCIAVVFLGLVFGMLYTSSDLAMPFLFIIVIVGLLWIVALTYCLFARQAMAKGKQDALDMAAKYESIKAKRKHLRNLKRTHDRIKSLKAQRTVEDRNRHFLRKLNVLRSESMAFF